MKTIKNITIDTFRKLCRNARKKGDVIKALHSDKGYLVLQNDKIIGIISNE